MSNMDPLADLDKLLRQLEVRNLYPQVRRFLADLQIRPASGWGRIQTAIEKHHGTPGFENLADDLALLVRDAVLTSNKRAYLLASADVDFARLAPPLPDGLRTDYLASDAPPDVPSAQQLGWFLEQRSVGDAVVYTYVATRQVRKSQDIEVDDLTEDARSRYKGARLMARLDVKFRCYDHFVRFRDIALLLLDEPDGVDTAVVNRDEVNYALALRDTGGERSSYPFVDLFPSVEKLWRAKSEGIVNHLEFVSNRRAQIRGRFSPTSKENYREQEFQLAGEQGGAQVSPYKIAVKWTDRDGDPVVVLPGRAEMVAADILDGRGERARLNFMELPAYMSWGNFVFALGRVRAYLNSTDQSS